MSNDDTADHTPKAPWERKFPQGAPRHSSETPTPPRPLSVDPRKWQKWLKDKETAAQPRLTVADLVNRETGTFPSITPPAVAPQARPTAPPPKPVKPPVAPTAPIQAFAPPSVEELTASLTSPTKTPTPPPVPRPPVTPPPAAVTPPMSPPTPTATPPRPSLKPAAFAAVAPPLAEAPAEPTRIVGQDEPAARHEGHPKARRAGRFAVATLAVLTFIPTGLGWSYLRSTDNSFQEVEALEMGSKDVVNAAGQTGDETFLIIGTDSRAGDNGNLGAGTDKDLELEGTARSDTVMLVNIPANRSRAVVVNFPRDLDVTRPACNVWDNKKAKYTDETVSAASNQKLNSVYMVGGPKCLVKTLQRISGLRIGHFVGMDFIGFERMVDAVGGVEVCSRTPLVDLELGTVLERSGRQVISGDTALNYVRARQVTTELSSDYSRIKRQQRFLSALLRSALSQSVLLDLSKLTHFVDAFIESSFVERVDTADLITLGRSMQNVDAGAVTFLTVPTAGTNELGNEIPRTSDIHSIFEAIISDNPLPGEQRETEPEPKPTKTTSATTSTAAESSLSAVSPSKIRVRVSNASGVLGAASTAANDFADHGFAIDTVGNYAGHSDKTIIRYPLGYEAEAQTVASTIHGAQVVVSSDISDAVEVVLGADFTGAVGPPTEAGKALPTAATVSIAEELPTDLTFTNAADNSCS